MRVALLCDLHIFLTSEKMVRKALSEAGQQNPDVMVIAGDHSGSYWGYKGARAVFRIARASYKGPIVACLGNHDYWFRGDWCKARDFDGSRQSNHPSLSDWITNIETIHRAAEEYDIHLLETKGVWRHPGWYGFAIAGHGLWYARPPYSISNDDKHMPIGIEGDTHRYMYKKTTNELLTQLDSLTDDDLFRVFVSHFPVVELKEHDYLWSGDPNLGQMLQDQHGFTTFLNGHTHGDFSGPLRWESGGGPFKAKYKIISI